MISAEKVMNIKVVELTRSTTFILVIYSSDKVVVTLFTNFTSLSYSFINYKRDINLKIMLTTTLSDKEMTKIKVVDLEKLHNFVVDNFLI